MMASPLPSHDHDHMDVIDGVASVGLFWLLVSSVISCLKSNLI